MYIYISLSHSLTLSLSHSLTLSLSHSLTLSLPHSLTLSLSHSLTPSLPPSLLPSAFSIVNQMLWSQQLELPDSPGVLKRLKEREGGREGGGGEGGRIPHRSKTVTVGNRWSYSSK